jgi:ribosome modulation factor
MNTAVLNNATMMANRRYAMLMARRLGARAQLDGRPTSANPYFDENLMLRSAWLLGWLNAKLGAK